MRSIREGRIRVETHRVRLGDHIVVTDVCGNPAGVPVMLLHGIPGWRGIWHEVAQRLAPDACVSAPDLLGFGDSSEPQGDGHAAVQAAAIVALLRQRGGRPVHLVGFDFGGPVAVLVYRQAPGLVASLLLAATNVLTDTPIPAPLQLVRPPLLGDVVARMVFSRTGLTLMWFAAVVRRERFPLDRYRDMLRFPRGVAWTRRIFQSSLRDLPGLYGPVHDALATIKVPCTVLWGDRDPFFPLAVGERTAAQVNGAEFVSLPGCGHFVPEEDPDGFAAAVVALMRRAGAGAGAA